ncbi:hypothetical protein PQX77_020183 [Marasmius sp. AFHP31]|nr:hypothetical protein PQX77_020183 [Marasmius sp. AFHP31]
MAMANFCRCQLASQPPSNVTHAADKVPKSSPATLVRVLEPSYKRKTAEIAAELGGTGRQGKVGSWNAACVMVLGRRKLIDGHAELAIVVVVFGKSAGAAAGQDKLRPTRLDNTQNHD